MLLSLDCFCGVSAHFANANAHTHVTNRGVAPRSEEETTEDGHDDAFQDQERT